MLERERERDRDRDRERERERERVCVRLRLGECVLDYESRNTYWTSVSPGTSKVQ